MTYIDHHAEPTYIPGRAPVCAVTHSWAAFTDARLSWLYGPDHRATRAALTQADVAAWHTLGTRRSAA